MSNLRQAAQQALEALEFYYDQHGEESDARVITALRAALAEPEQNPFGDDAERYARKLREEREYYKALFTERKPEQEPVAWYYERGTDKGISFAPDRDPYKDWQALYTAPPEAVEPIAWMVYTDGGASAYVTDNPSDLIGAYRALPLYTAPTPRKPVELTNQEIQAVWAKTFEMGSSANTFARAVIAAYEAKNGITGETK